MKKIKRTFRLLTKKLIFIFFCFLYLPILLGFKSEGDGDLSIFKIMLGGGMYQDVARDCSGGIVSTKEIPYIETGASYEHTFEVVKVKINAGYFKPQKENIKEAFPFQRHEREFGYVTPMFGYNSQYFEIELGTLIPIFKKQPEKNYELINNPNPACRIRIGNRNKFNFTAGFLDNTLLFTEGGAMNMGVNFPVSESKLYFGIGGIPMDGAMISARADLKTGENIWLLLNGNIGIGDVAEYSMAAGLSFSL